MKKLLLTSALALGLAAPAYAGDITITGINLNDPQAFGAGTVNGYSYYDGPIDLSVQGQSDIEVYCADLNHELHDAVYHYGLLKENGLGVALTIQQSDIIGKIAEAGFADLLASTFLGNEAAAAAQLAIWSIEYNTLPTSFANGDIETDFWGLYGTTPDAHPQWAEVIIANGAWPGNSDLSQQMVVGFGGVPEPSTWAMMLLGFAGLGYAALRRAGKPSVAALA